MSRAKRGVVSVSAAALLLTGSSLFVGTPTAAADTVTATQCGGTVKAAVGDTVNVVTDGHTIPLGTVSKTTDALTKPLTSLLATLLGKTACTVNVDIVNTAASTVDSTAKTASKTVSSVSKTAGDTVKKTTDTVKDAVTPKQSSPGSGGSNPSHQSPSSPTSGSKDSNSGSHDAKPASKATPSKDVAPSIAGAIGTSNSAPFSSSVPGFSGLPLGSLPTSSSFKSPQLKELSFSPVPSAALRYGSHFKQYQPQFGSLAPASPSGPTTLPAPTSNDTFNNAGQAESLPSGSGSGIGLPVLLAVLALAGVSAGLVRTWVLQKAAALA